jgi:hypothetical protein
MHCCSIDISSLLVRYVINPCAETIGSKASRNLCTPMRAWDVVSPLSAVSVVSDSGVLKVSGAGHNIIREQ